jgi:hypothetical protein
MMPTAPHDPTDTAEIPASVSVSPSSRPWMITVHWPAATAVSVRRTLLAFNSPRTSRPPTLTSNGTRGDPGGTVTPASPLRIDDDGAFEGLRR